MTEIPPRPPAAPLADVAAAQDYDDDAPHRGDWPRASGRQVARLLAPLAAERDRLRAGPPPAAHCPVCADLPHSPHGVPARPDPFRCPDCHSPQPGMHPAVSGGGEVTRLCEHEFHAAPAPPETATSLEALAAEFEMFADGYAGDGRAASDRGDSRSAAVSSARCNALRACAEKVRELAPQWDALAAERDHYRATVADLGVRVEQLKAGNVRLRERFTAIADMWGAIGGDLGTCARILREAMEARDGR